MNIEEAIEHCKEQAKVCSIKKCADDHLQLAKWLEELKELRKLFTLSAEEVGFIKDELIPTYLERYEPEGVYQLFRIKPCKNLLTRIKTIEQCKYKITLNEKIYEDDYHGHDTLTLKKLYSCEKEMTKEIADVVRDIFCHINSCNRIVKLQISEIHENPTNKGTEPTSD